MSTIKTTYVTVTNPDTPGYAMSFDASNNATVFGSLSSPSVSDTTTAIYPILSSVSVTPSGTAVDFLDIPSWVRRLTFVYRNVSTSGTANPIIQLGSSAGFLTTGYLGSGGYTGSSGFGVIGFPTGMPLGRAESAADTRHGIVVIENIRTNSWVSTSVGAVSQSNFNQVGASSTAMSGLLDRVRFTTVGGTDTFDAGASVILYWE